MQVQTLIKVEMGDVDGQQVSAFRSEMESRGWSSFPTDPFAFCATIEGNPADKDIVESSEEDVTWSAELARIYNWDAVCIIGDRPALV